MVDRKKAKKRLSPAVKSKSKAVNGNPVQPDAFPIVGIGASAGGLEAITQIFSALPVDTGMAFVVIQHLDPTHQSLAPEILSRTTKMPVQEVQDGMRVLPNNVYLIPSKCDMEIIHGKLKLVPRTETRGQHLVIDSFFQSLATDQRGRAVGVVLSGTASDGTLGLKAIKAEGGIAIVQDPKTAKFDGMPKSAIASGVVDLILPPKAIAEELSRIAHHPYIRAACEAKTVTQEEDNEGQPEAALRKIFTLLRSHTHVDFSNYKHTTLKRRLERRMMVRKSESVEAYVKYLKDHPEEIKALYTDFLINVTEFFRDPNSFKAMTDQAFPSLMKNREAGSPIRVWVPGCATGEEAYSLAMLLLEFLDDEDAKTPIQIFATDISEQAIRKARAGVYSEGIERVVSKARLSRFFEKVENGFKISKAVRDLCLFSKHDVTGDPPFSKLDIVSCRNVLIYFAASLQKRVIPIFHYALKPGGFLWLGRSESSGFSNLFSLVDQTHRIYSKINVPTPSTFRFPPKSHMPEINEIGLQARGQGSAGSDFQKDPDHIALARYAPPGVLVNADLEILQFRGRTSPYLEPAAGFASNHLLKMARSELRSGLRMAVHSASKKNGTARNEGLSFEVDGRRREVNIEVIPTNPQEPIKQRNFMIFFEEVLQSTALSKPAKNARGEKPGLKKGKAKKTPEEQRQVTKHLEQELYASQQFQHSMTDEFEATKEELTSANEELQSTNEELQSSNEELETAKEELQSSNEELSTVNDELQNRNTELSVLGSDLNNLFISTEIPIILIIGGDRRIRRFTPKAEKYFKLTPSDIGRPISDIKSNFDLDLDAMVSEVVHTLTPQEREILGNSGRWLRVHVRPYKTLDNRIDGAVIVLVDIHDLKQRLEISDVALKYSMSVAETVQLPFVVLDFDMRLMSANTSFFEYFQISQEEVGTKLFDILGIRHGGSAGLLAALNQTLTSKNESQKFEIDFESPDLGTRKLQVSAKKIQWLGTEAIAILVALEDITERRRVEEELAQTMIREKEARADAESGNRAKDVFLATLSHELRTPLSAILTWAQMIRMGKVDFENAKHGASVIEQSAKNQARLIDDLLDVSRVIMGKLHLEKTEVDPAAVIRAAFDTVRPMAEKKNIQIETILSTESGMVLADSVRLEQVVCNLLTNAIKFSPKDNRIELRLKYIKDQAGRLVEITVTDHGKGIGPDFLPHIFDRFSQADSASTRAHGGLGLGLSIVRNLVELHDGTIQVASAGENKGSVFTVTLPVLSLKATLKTPSDSTIQNDSPLQAENETQETSLNGLRLLYVDDDESTREVITIFLKSSGAVVMTAESASEALKVLETFKPNVLLSDIFMPDEDGYALIRKIRALGREHGGDIPAIALTANATSQDAQQSLKAGFQAHLAKPVDPQLLGLTIAKLARSAHQSF